MASFDTAFQKLNTSSLLKNTREGQIPRRLDYGGWFLWVISEVLLVCRDRFPTSERI
jgi:hypothetical protein